MHTPEKIEVMRQMRKNSKSQQLKFVRLEKNLEVLMEKRGVYIDETMEKDLHTIMENKLSQYRKRVFLMIHFKSFFGNNR